MDTTRLEGMGALPPALHRAIVCVDVEAFGDQRRNDVDQVVVRSGLYRSLRETFDVSGVPWADCYHEDRGDGVFVLVPPDVPKNHLVADLPRKLAAALHKHNLAHGTEARIRVRMAIHAGEVRRDDHGVAGSAVNFTFRLLEAAALRYALARSSGVVAMIASRWFFEEVIRQDRANNPAQYRRVAVSVKETETTAWICLPDSEEAPHVADDEAGRAVPAPLPGPMVAAMPRQLPPAPAGFAGRTTELSALTRLLAETTGARSALVITVISGTAGVGKTALAVRWAHQVADRFPDGQLYVNLRGFDPTGPPLTPAEAIRGLLDAFEVPAERIPGTVAGQAGMYRSLTAGRRMLLVLDNARDTEQVRPLLPGVQGCIVVTSRHRLTGLITAEGAHPLSLGMLTVEEARHLLINRVGADRVSAEPGPVAEIISCCAQLPLTLSIAAARAATHPSFQLSTIAAELRDARGGLEAFEGGELGTDARAVFSWSYEQLDAAAAGLFRLLALHPGPDITVPAAASLAGAAGPKQVRRTLDELARCHLVDEHSPGRFAFHDLLRVYATELARLHDPERDRHDATCRMLDHYLHTAHQANVRIYPHAEPISISPLRPGTVAQDIPDHAAAWAWFEAELPVLLAIVSQAASQDCGGHAWWLPWTLLEYFRRSGHWQDWAAAYHVALAAARRSDDPYGQARTHQGLGRACSRLGRYAEARVHLQQALDMFEGLNRHAGEVAGTHLALSTTFEHLDSAEDALIHAQEALAVSRAADDPLWEARALNRIGWYQALLGRPRETLAQCERALSELRELNDRGGEARVLDSMGYAHHQLGDHKSAFDYLERSLALRRELGDRLGEAIVLNHMGDSHHALGDSAAAHAVWRGALEILTRLGHPYATRVGAKLGDVSDHD